MPASSWKAVHEAWLFQLSNQSSLLNRSTKTLWLKILEPGKCMHKSTLTYQHCLWTTKRKPFLLFWSPLSHFNFCLAIVSQFFFLFLLVSLSRLSRMVVGAARVFLCPVLRKMVAEGRQEGWGWPSLHCQSCTRKSKASPVCLHETKGKVGGTPSVVLLKIHIMACWQVAEEQLLYLLSHPSWDLPGFKFLETGSSSSSSKSTANLLTLQILSPHFSWSQIPFRIGPSHGVKCNMQLGTMSVTLESVSCWLSPEP